MEAPATDTLYEIALSMYKGISKPTAATLAGRGVGPREFFTLDSGALAAVSGLRRDFFSDTERSRVLECARRELDFIASNRITAAFYTSADYPRRLSECDDAPVVLYRLGRQVADSSHVVSVVGTRHSTAYGIDFTDHLVRDLASAFDDLLIVSGLAYGIDIAAHKAALREGVPTAAVLAHGLNTVYPADHRGYAAQIVRDGGFLATEYTTADRIHKGSFLARNRIIAGLCDALVVVESDLRGGAMSTARIASDYNREVLAVPGRVNDTYSRGCNQLIASSGAALIRDASDLIELLGWIPRPSEGTQKELPIDISPIHSTVLEFIRHNPAATVNDMCASLEMPFSRLSSTLFEMEMADLIISMPGGRYAPVSV